MYVYILHASLSKCMYIGLCICKLKKNIYIYACMHTLHYIALHTRAHTHIYIEVSNAIHLLYTLICLEFLDVFPPPQTSIGTSDSCGPPSRRAMVCVYRPSHTSCLGMASKIVLTMVYLCISMHIYIYNIFDYICL